MASKNLFVTIRGVTKNFQDVMLLNDIELVMIREIELLQYTINLINLTIGLI